MTRAKLCMLLVGLGLLVTVFQIEQLVAQDFDQNEPIATNLTLWWKTKFVIKDKNGNETNIIVYRSELLATKSVDGDQICTIKPTGTDLVMYDDSKRCFATDPLLSLLGKVIHAITVHSTQCLDKSPEASFRKSKCTDLAPYRRPDTLSYKVVGNSVYIYCAHSFLVLLNASSSVCPNSIFSLNRSTKFFVNEKLYGDFPGDSLADKTLYLVTTNPINSIVITISISLGSLLIVSFVFVWRVRVKSRKIANLTTANAKLMWFRNSVLEQPSPSTPESTPVSRKVTKADMKALKLFDTPSQYHTPASISRNPSGRLFSIRSGPPRTSMRDIESGFTKLVDWASEPEPVAAATKPAGPIPAGPEQFNPGCSSTPAASKSVDKLISFTADAPGGSTPSAHLPTSQSSTAQSGLPCFTPAKWPTLPPWSPVQPTKPLSPIPVSIPAPPPEPPKTSLSKPPANLGKPPTKRKSELERLGGVIIPGTECRRTTRGALKGTNSDGLGLAIDADLLNATRKNLRRKPL